MVLDPTHRQELRSLVFFSGDKIYINLNTKCSRRYRRICEESALNLLSNTIKIIGILCFANLINGIFITITFITNNEIQLPIPVFFPFTDLESAEGLIINLISQFCIIFMGVVGNIGIEITTCIIRNTIWMMAATMCYAIEEITLKIKEPMESKNIDYRFRNILLQEQDLDR